MTSARAAALRALVALEKGRVQRLRDELEAVQLEPRERGLAWELAHGVLRRERLLDFVLAGFALRGLPKDPVLRSALRLGVYQLAFLRGMPARAAVYETVALVRQNKAFANAVLRRAAERIEHRAADPAAVRTELPLGSELTFVLPSPLPEDPAARAAVLHSLPDFVVARWSERLGAETALAVAAAASAVPAVFLRAAAGEDLATLRRDLEVEGVRTGPAEHPRLLRAAGGMSPFATAAFAAGRFAVQDPTALRAAEAVPCRPGDTVVDLCAAPGTKTTVLAERVRGSSEGGPDGNGGGLVVAFDLDPRRAERIAENARRLRLESWIRIAGSTAELPPADAVLADVPCSNTGVLARRVEVRRRLQPGTFALLAQQQRALLGQALALAKPGGAVVYSTCSIEPEENEAVVAAVAAEPTAPRFTVERTEATLPAAGEHDGGWYAVLRRDVLRGDVLRGDVLRGENG